MPAGLPLFPDYLTGGCTESDLATLTSGGISADAAAILCAGMANQNIVYGVNTMFLLLCGALVFIMHAGFAMLCAGAIRSKNTMNILLQTILDAATSAIAWYTVGYAFAYGQGDNMRNGFIGDAMFGAARYTTNASPTGQPGAWTDWFYQWTFCATATTIPAGAVAERFNFNAYLGYSFFISAWVYPVIAHWAWSVNGWMSAFNTTNAFLNMGYMDFAGSGVVHMVGGFAGLVGCVLVGPRLGRFDPVTGKPKDMPGHSATLVVLGTCLLWFGWYGFNPGSMATVTNVANWAVIGRAAATTTLSGAAGGIAALVTAALFNKAWDLVAVCNGVLVGFVSITAGCHVLEPWAAILAGMVGSWIFDATCLLWLKLKIDDPLSASPMHGVCGMWGVFVVGLLAKEDYITQVYGTKPQQGLFYKGEGYLLACQVIGILVILGWTVVNMTLFFSVFKFFGKLRISAEEELQGLDVSKHGGSAYAGGDAQPVSEAIVRV